MRIRSIKPDFWRSDDLDRLDWHTRLVYIGLWSYVDDNGVGREKAALLRQATARTLRIARPPPRLTISQWAAVSSRRRP